MQEKLKSFITNNWFSIVILLIAFGLFIYNGSMVAKVAELENTRCNAYWKIQCEKPPQIIKEYNCNMSAITSVEAIKWQK